MYSALDDTKDLADSTDGENPNKFEGPEIQKIKEEHRKEIKILTYESKLKLLETENEMRMKIISLEKDNQTLNHQLQITKLKNSHEIETKQILADQELQNKLTETEKRMAAMGNEMTIKLVEKDKEIAAKENEYTLKLMIKELEMSAAENENNELNNIIRMKMNDLVNEHKLKLLELTKEKDETIQKLRNEIEKFKSKGSDEAQEEDKPPSVFTNEWKFAWGADTFFGGKTMKWEESAYESYEDWYKGISLLLTNKKQENIVIGGKKYVFIKKEFNECHIELYIGLKESVHHEDTNDIMVEGLSEESRKDGEFLLLHPTLSESFLKFVTSIIEGRWWKVQKVDENFYFGDEKSAIILVKC